MHIDMDVPDLARARGRKRVGRKHNHQPRGRAMQRRLDHLRHAAERRLALQQRFNALVAAYWRGEIENYPDE